MNPLSTKKNETPTSPELNSTLRSPYVFIPGTKFGTWYKKTTSAA